MRLLSAVMFVLTIASVYVMRRKQEKKGFAVHKQTTPPAPARPAVEKPTLEHRDWKVRLEAVQALAENKDESALAALLLALSDPDSDVREAATQALIQRGPQAVPGLLDALRTANADAQQLAVRALGEIGDVRALDDLLEVLRHESMWVRGEAVQALGKLRHASAVPALIAALNDREIDVRDYAASALRRIGTPEAMTALHNRPESPGPTE